MFNKFETPTEYHSPFTYLDPLLKEDDYFDPPCEQYTNGGEEQSSAQEEPVKEPAIKEPKVKQPKKAWYQKYEREMPFLLIIIFVVIIAVLWTNLNNLHAKVDMLMMNKK